jgi:hypothetical protein
LFAAIAAASALACLVGNLPAQDNPAGAGSGETKVAPAVAGDKPEAVDLDKAQQAQRDLEALLSMKKEDLEKFLAQACKDRLLAERQQVVAEIQAEILYDPKKVDLAVKLINDKPLDTQADNISRFIGAFALVEIKVGGPYGLYQQGEQALVVKDVEKAKLLFQKSADDMKLVLNSEDHTNLSAVEHYLNAMALGKGGRDIPSVEAFNNIAVEMPERISFAAAATLEAANLYEKLGRNLYAMEMYAYCLTNYGLTLGLDEAKKITDRIEEIGAIYKDPFNTLAAKMEEVHGLLGKLDTGKATQDKEKQIAMVLADLIQTEEEKQQQQQKQSKPGNAKKGQGEGEPKEGEGEPKEGEGKGNKPGQPKGVPKNPTTGAKTSATVPGPTARPNTQGQIYDPTKGEGDWSKLPPRDRERLQELAKKAMAERYRDIISDYTAKIADVK